MPLFRPSRRALLSMAAAAPTLALPVRAQAQALGAPPASNPAHMQFTLGEMTLTVVSDGHLELPANSLGVNAEPDEVRAFLESYFLSTDTNYAHANHLVIQTGEATVLVDTGSGSRFLPTAGRLAENLGKAGIDPSAITHVLITHAHPDHIWGIRDDFDEALFPDAAYFAGQTEYDYWMQDDLVNQVPPEMQQFVVGAVNSFQVEGVDWTLLANDQEVVPGVRVTDTPGHTPGHLSVIVESNGQQLIALGDSMSHAYMNFSHPDWVNNFDMDAETTQTTRKRLLDMAAADRMAVLGYHFPFPGVGHVRTRGEAYEFVPALWQW